MADVLRLADRFNGLAEHPACRDYVARATARPSFVTAHADQMAHFVRQTATTTPNADHCESPQSAIHADAVKSHGSRSCARTTNVSLASATRKPTLPNDRKWPIAARCLNKRFASKLSLVCPKSTPGATATAPIFHFCRASQQFPVEREKPSRSRFIHHFIYAAGQKIKRMRTGKTNHFTHFKNL